MSQIKGCPEEYAAALHVLQQQHDGHEIAIEEVAPRMSGHLVAYQLDGAPRLAIIRQGSIRMDRPQGVVADELQAS